jgi:predicted transcriptional regulator
LAKEQAPLGPARRLIYVRIWYLTHPEQPVIALSIELPEELAQASLEIARELGLSRTELIRQAVVHEIAQARGTVEQRAMAESLRAMGADPSARRLAEELDAAMDTPLPPEEDGWWSR